MLLWFLLAQDSKLPKSALIKTELTDSLSLAGTQTDTDELQSVQDDCSHPSCPRTQMLSLC